MKTSRERQNEKGFSLIELLIVSVILVVTIGLIASIVAGVQRSLTRERPRTEAASDAAAALDMITRLIRMAGNNPQRIAGLEAIDPGNKTAGEFHSIRIRSDWRGAASADPPDGDIGDGFEDTQFFVDGGKLMKKEPSDAGPVVFLDHVSDIRFSYFDRNGAAVDPVSKIDRVTRVAVEVTVQPEGTTSPMSFTSSAHLRAR